MSHNLSDLRCTLRILITGFLTWLLPSTARGNYFTCTFFPKQFTVRGSQCFKEWSPWCWMVWSGSRPACLPLPFICLPVLFICLPSSVLVVGFPAGLSPTSFHLSPTSFHLSPRLGACGRVPGWLVSHFLLFVSHFFFPKQFTVRGSQCFKEWSPWCWMVWSGSRPACLPLPFICLPVLFICLPSSVLVVGFPAGLSPTSFHLSPASFHLSPRLGACGRVPGWLVSHFLLFVSHFFSFVFQFFSFVSQAGCLWSGSQLACLPLPFICLPLLFICLPVLFICLPGWVLVVGFPAGLSPTSFHLSPSSFYLSPRLVACCRVRGWLVSHFL